MPVTTQSHLTAAQALMLICERYNIDPHLYPEQVVEQLSGRLDRMRDRLHIIRTRIDIVLGTQPRNRQ